MYNPYLLIPLLVWAITQFLKFIVAAAQGRLDFRYLYASGGMPSVHSAVVTSLATTAFLVDGPRSSNFGITAILAGIVMYDSFGVRRASGEQATAINLILDSLSQDRVQLAHPQRRLRELLGHKPLEVTIGAGIGFVLACLFNLDKLHQVFEFLATPVHLPITIALGVLSLLLLLMATIGRWVYIRRYRKIEVITRAVKRTSWLAAAYGMVGLLLAFLEYEKVTASLWLIWSVLYLLSLIASTVMLTKPFRSAVPAALREYQQTQDKQKWFEGPNKKRRAAKARAKKRK